MYADGGILCCDARLPRQVAELAILQIHDPQRMSIFRLESREKAGNTLADLLSQHRIGLLDLRELSAPSLHGPCRGGPLTVMVDNGIAQDPIEPSHNLFILHAGPALQSARKRCLQDVFGGGSGLDAPLQEGQKLPVSANQLRYRLGR